MIFIIEKLTADRTRLERFDSVSDVARSLEWQDVYGGAYTIIADSGAVYDWDRSKQEEFATVYGYTLVTICNDRSLAQRCREEFERAGWPVEIEETKGNLTRENN